MHLVGTFLTESLKTREVVKLEKNKLDRDRAACHGIEIALNLKKKNKLRACQNESAKMNRAAPYVSKYGLLRY